MKLLSNNQQSSFIKSLKNKRVGNTLLTLLFFSAIIFGVMFFWRSRNYYPVIVVGASASGVAFIKELCTQGFKGPILWVADQQENPYNKVKIASVLAGSKTVDAIALIDLSTLPSSVNYRFNTKVIKVNPVNSTVTLQTGKVIRYGTLFLGTGMRYEVPQQFKNISGVFSFGTLSDALAIKNYIEQRKVKTAVIVGFGFNGAEVADVIADKKIAVHIVDHNSRIFAKYTNSAGAQFLQNKIIERNVTVHLNTTVQDILSDNKGVTQVILANGKTILAELVIFTIGGKLNTNLISNTAIATQDQGILVNSQLQTTVSTVYAAGDAILIIDLITEKLRKSVKWADAEKQAIVAARAFLGDKDIVYKGSSFIQKTHVFGWYIASCGPVAVPVENYEQIIYKSPDYYYLFLLNNSLLKGFLLLSSRKFSFLKELKRLIEQKELVSVEKLTQLIFSGTAGQV